MSTYKDGAYYRKTDGVRITHDPYSPGMVEKYGKPGKTDNEGFDPYADTVGPGIYGGIVKRDKDGEVVVGRQYQNHNPRPGPVYAGGGYAPISEALKSIKGKLIPLLEKYPDLANAITTGGAQPLHMCGMSRSNQHAVETLVKYGADIEAIDTYGFTPLQRMASNNLAVGAQMLIDAGADPNFKGKCGSTPMDVARSSAASGVIKVLGANKSRKEVAVSHVIVESAGAAAVNGKFVAKSADVIPAGFDKVCVDNNWNTKKTWAKLNGDNGWFKHEGNESYIYFNKSDGKWWLDGPDGMGLYTNSNGVPYTVPAHGWKSLKGEKARMPAVRTYRGGSMSTDKCEEKSSSA